MSSPPSPTPRMPASRAGLDQEIDRRVRHALDQFYATQVSPGFKDLWAYVLGQTESITLLGEAAVSDQDQLNALAQALNDLAAKEASDDAGLTASVAAVQAEITALQNQPAGTPLDWTAVNAALASVTSAAATNATDIAAVAALVPAPAPSPAPTPPAGG